MTWVGVCILLVAQASGIDVVGYIDGLHWFYQVALGSTYGIALIQDVGTK